MNKIPSLAMQIYELLLEKQPALKLKYRDVCKVSNRRLMRLLRLPYTYGHNIREAMLWLSREGYIELLAHYPTRGRRSATYIFRLRSRELVVSASG